MDWPSWHASSGSSRRRPSRSTSGPSTSSSTPAWTRRSANVEPSASTTTPTGATSAPTAVVEPQRVYAHDGQWYLAAHCRRAGGDRIFRLDRIESAEVLDEIVETTTARPDHADFAAAPEARRVVLELTPRARWVPEQYPCEEVEELDDGGIRVTFVAATTSVARAAAARSSGPRCAHSTTPRRRGRWPTRPVGCLARYRRGARLGPAPFEQPAAARPTPTAMRCDQLGWTIPHGSTAW
ncbi:MAG: WYL domain-containing protein [Acidimicrobiia bacterium]|nr:WYL domain-containing protein [Acidimicrobiia bacterium]